MKCPYCAHDTTEVVETRDSEDLAVTRRRRGCNQCSKRFTTYERVELSPLVVVKKNGKRENFDRDKLLRGIAKAAQKTTLLNDDISAMVDEIERELRIESSNGTDGVTSQLIGQLVANKLKKRDKVAYIRFASVFKSFVDVEEFKKELHKLL